MDIYECKEYRIIRIYSFTQDSPVTSLFRAFTARRSITVLICLIAGAIATLTCCLGLGLALSMLPSTAIAVRSIRRAANAPIVIALIAFSMAYIAVADINVEVHIWGREYILSQWELKLVMGLGTLNLAATIAAPRSRTWIKRILRTCSS